MLRLLPPTARWPAGFRRTAFPRTPHLRTARLPSALFLLTAAWLSIDCTNVTCTPILVPAITVTAQDCTSATEDSLSLQAFDESGRSLQVECFDCSCSAHPATGELKFITRYEGAEFSQSVQVDPDETGCHPDTRSFEIRTDGTPSLVELVPVDQQ